MRPVLPAEAAPRSPVVLPHSVTFTSAVTPAASSSPALPPEVEVSSSPSVPIVAIRMSLPPAAGTPASPAVRPTATTVAPEPVRAFSASSPGPPIWRIQATGSGSASVPASSSGPEPSGVVVVVVFNSGMVTVAGSSVSNEQPTATTASTIAAAAGRAARLARDRVRWGAGVTVVGSSRRSVCRTGVPTACHATHRGPGAVAPDAEGLFSHAGTLRSPCSVWQAHGHERSAAPRPVTGLCGGRPERPARPLHDGAPRQRGPGRPAERSDTGLVAGPGGLDDDGRSPGRGGRAGAAQDRQRAGGARVGRSVPSAGPAFARTVRPTSGGPVRPACSRAVRPTSSGPVRPACSRAVRPTSGGPVRPACSSAAGAARTGCGGSGGSVRDRCPPGVARGGARHQRGARPRRCGRPRRPGGRRPAGRRRGDRDRRDRGGRHPSPRGLLRPRRSQLGARRAAGQDRLGQRSARRGGVLRGVRPGLLAGRACGCRPRRRAALRRGTG